MAKSIRITLEGCDTARCGKVTVKGKSPVCAMARIIVAKRPDLTDVIADVRRDGTRVYTPTPLSWFAGKTTSEGNQSVKMVDFVDMAEVFHG